MPKVKIEISARHCHLSNKDALKLLGHNYKLQVDKPLSQKGEFASQFTLTVKTKDGELGQVRVIGPIRKQTQVEISLTDARKLKINPPVRLSGRIHKSAGVLLIGPHGRVKITEGVIIAKRHLHCHPYQAKKLGLQKGQEVSVKTGGQRSMTFHQVEVRLADNFDLAVHLDTDEGNAASLLGSNNLGEIIKK